MRETIFNVSAHNRSIVVALFSDLYNMIVIKQRQFLQEFTFAISLESGRSSLIEKKGQHKTRHVQHVPKHVNVAYLAFYKESHVDRNCLYGSFHNYVDNVFYFHQG